ncbi:MAG TPA: S-methyl-5-thioribose-1-phosphate isomerase [bacterium]|nr:S-methyl-5-thioribose-1-phosphate isomerase [bacterium]
MKSKLRPIRWEGKTLLLLDQRLLPLKEKWVKCDTVEKVALAIEDMTVRGAPAIGITAAYGVALAAVRSRAKNPALFQSEIERSIARLRKTRPTAVNLFWALDRMQKKLSDLLRLSLSSQKQGLEREAIAIHREDEALCALLGKYGAQLLSKCRNVLTHCNTGALATGGDGTALAGITEAARKNRALHVWVDETRPYLQGARLTAYELAHAGVQYHLITDNMAADLMKRGKVDAVIVGADRIVANGDTANKIGTYALAVLCQAHGIPFYVAAPTSTLDLTKKTGAEIVIEQRNPKEVTHPQGIPIAKEGTPVYNPAFDVTPGKLISAIVLESGICRYPYMRSLKMAKYRAGKGPASR